MLVYENAAARCPRPRQPEAVMSCKAHLLLVCGLTAFALEVSAYDYTHFELAPRALVFELKDGAANLGDSDGVYAITNYIVNDRVEYVNLAKDRFVAFNLPGYWTIGALEILPSIISLQAGTLQERLDQGGFTGFHFAAKTQARAPTESWAAYDVRTEDVVAIAFSRKDMHVQDPHGAEGVYGLTVHRAWAATTPTILGGSMDWSCDDDSCDKTNVYINFAKNKFLVQDDDGWVIDNLDNLERTLERVSNVNKQLRQQNEDVTQGWQSFTVAVSAYYALDVEGSNTAATGSLTWGGRYVVSGEANGKPVYRNDETNAIISFDASTASWEESAAPYDRRAPEGELLDGMAWETSVVSIRVNFRVPEQAAVEHPGRCEDQCIYTGGTPVPSADGAPSKCLFSPHAMRSWEQAEQYCEMHGGHLASITSAEENELVFSVFQQAGDGGPSFWIGMREEFSEENQSQGHWRWSDGSPMMFSNWSPAQPDDWHETPTSGGEDCGMMRTGWSARSEWNDLACHKELPFVCAKLYNPPPADCTSE